MVKKYVQADNAEMRRVKVAQLLRRGFNQTQIQDALSKPGTNQVLNPETGEPYGLATIHRDVVELRERWKDEIARDIGEHFAEMIEKLSELERQAWMQNDLKLVLDVLKEKAKLFGLYSPVKIEVDWRTEVVHMLIQGQISVGMLRNEIDDQEILEGIIAHARLLGYEAGSDSEEIGTDARIKASTEVIDIDSI